MIAISAECAEKVKRLPKGIVDFVYRVFTEVFKDDSWKLIARRPLLRSGDYFHIRMERLTVFFIIEQDGIVITGIRYSR